MRLLTSRASLTAALFACVALFSPRVHAGACKLTNVGGLNFGTYDPLSSIPMTTVGSLSYSCPQGQGAPLITISQGLYGTFAARAMQNSADPTGLLFYNLYVDASCTLVWGDGTSGTVTQSGPVGRPVTIPVYGKLPPRQNVAAGTFNDTVTVTFNF